MMEEGKEREQKGEVLHGPERGRKFIFWGMFHLTLVSRAVMLRTRGQR